MQNFIYEMQRTFRSKLVIVMMIIIILASSLVAYGITGPGSPKPVIKPSMTHAAQAVIFNIMNAVFLFLIPVLAIFEGYIIYGKDRTNGVLESVVTRPTTKGQILFSRFFACAASIFIGLLLSTLIIDAGVASYYATGLPLSMMLALIAAYLVAGAAFIGLVFLLSHLVKSQTSVLGLAITIFLVMVIFWDTITFLILILALKLSPGTYRFRQSRSDTVLHQPCLFRIKRRALCHGREPVWRILRHGNQSCRIRRDADFPCRRGHCMDGIAHTLRIRYGKKIRLKGICY